MARTWTWLILDTSICILNMLLHGIGLCFLIPIYKSKQKAYLITLINFALAELISNTVHLVHEIIDIQSKRDNTPYEHAHQYIAIVRNPGMTMQTFYVLFCITADRLLAVCLSHRYPVTCTVGRYRIVAILTWVVTVFTTTALSLHYKFTDSITFHVVSYLYIDFIVGIIFLIFAIVTYTYILVKYTNSNMRGVGGNATWKKHGSETTWRHRAYLIVKKTNYKVTVLLVLSFLVFVVIPDISNTILILTKNSSGLFSTIIGLSKQLADTLEALIYIFLFKPVRSLMRKKLSGKSRKRNSSSVGRSPSKTKREELVEESKGNDENKLLTTTV